LKNIYTTGFITIHLLLYQLIGRKLIFNNNINKKE